MEVIEVRGGPLDGMIGEIGAAPARLGFFVHWPRGGTMVWGYYDQRERNNDGLRIFGPGKVTDAETEAGEYPQHPSEHTLREGP